MFSFMKKKLQLGDRVLNLGKTPGPNDYKEGTVIEISANETVRIRYDDNNTGRGEMHYYKFIKHDKDFMKFKKGQKVKIIADSTSHGGSIGMVVTIKNLYDGKSDVYYVEEFSSYINEADMKKYDPKAPINFLLKYDLKSDPLEECATLEEVKERIEELVKNKDENGLKLDSITIYEIKSVKKITIETKVEIKGI